MCRRRASDRCASFTASQHVEDKLRKDGVREGSWTISRFKGLGEMNATQLWETTMDPDTRRLLPVQLGRHGQAKTHERFTMLMGKGEAAARRSWLEERSTEAGTTAHSVRDERDGAWRQCQAGQVGACRR